MKAKRWIGAASPIRTSKAQRGGLRGLAVRLTALLTYEQLGGEKKKEGPVKRWFKPANGLGNAGNSILCRGLQGSPLFESSGRFFHKLKSAIQSGDGEPRALHGSALATQANIPALPGTSDVLRRFDRDTWRVATGVLGGVIISALVLAVLVQEPHPEADDLTKVPRQAEGDLLLNANSATLFTVKGLNEMSSTGEMTSGEASSVDHAFTEISPHANPSSQMAAAASPPTPVFALTPEINRHDVQANAGSWTPAHRQNSGRAIGLKFPRARSWSSVRPSFVDLKMRLIAFWHQILTRNKRPRSWTQFSNSKKADRQKVSFTAATNH